MLPSKSNALRSNIGRLTGTALLSICIGVSAINYRHLLVRTYQSGWNTRSDGPANMAPSRNGTGGGSGYGNNFPLSTASPSVIFKYPGVTLESTEVARRTLTQNNHKNDIYERARFAHNHFPHNVLTRYALGAPAKLLEATWQYDDRRHVSLEPDAEDRDTDMSKVPEKIDGDNWDDPKYLGFDGSYSRYLKFFHEEIDRLGPVGALREYVFSARANWEGRNPRMLLRLQGGFFHPYIHAGFGVEFRDRVLIAEGLAQACIHKIDFFETVFAPDYPKDILTSKSPSSPATSTPLVDDWKPFDPSTDGNRLPQQGRSLLEIYAAICADSKLAPIPYSSDSLMRDRMLGAGEGDKGAKLWKLVGDWSLEDEELGAGPEGWERKVEEVAVLNTLLACATGRDGKEKRVDFFLMHALTSSIFLPSFLPILTIVERRALLQTYVLVCIQTALSRGRPRINPDLLMSYPLYPVGPGTGSKKGKDVVADPSDESTRNAWLSVIESSLYAHAIRSLVHWSSLYGQTPPGGFIGAYKDASSKGEVVPGLAKADGTIFIRAAGLVMDVMGWCREGQKEGSWDFSALGYDEAWK